MIPACGERFTFCRSYSRLETKTGKDYMSPYPIFISVLALSGAYALRRLAKPNITPKPEIKNIDAPDNGTGVGCSG